MTVSIQIPTYNQEQFIGKAIETALMQEYADLEIIVLDDCSKDKTFNVISSYRDSRLKVFRNERNLGRTKTYHKLLYELVGGEWVVNLDGDDYFTDKHFIGKGMESVKKNPAVVFYQACISNKTPDGSYRFRHKLLGNRDEGMINGREYFRNFHRNEFFGHLSTIYNVAKARKCGFYEHGNLTADAESMLKLALEGDVYLDNRLVGVWNIHSANESASNIDRNDEILRSFERLRDYSEKYIGEDDAERWYKEALAVNYRSYMGQIAERNFPQFLKEAIKSGYINGSFIKLVAKKLIGKI